MRLVRDLGRRSLALLLTAAAVIGCGSGDPDLISAVPAAGTASYQGKPIETGTIQFVPEKGRSAIGEIKNGQFTLTTYEDGDGAIPGKHQVGVTVTKQVPAKGGGEPYDVYVVPQQFADPATSGLTAEIPPDGKTDIAIDVK